MHALKIPLKMRFVKYSLSRVKYASLWRLLYILDINSANRHRHRLILMGPDHRKKRGLHEPGQGLCLQLGSLYPPVLTGFLEAAVVVHRLLSIVLLF